MSRLVTIRRKAGALAAGAPPEEPDNALARIAKYVPAEVLAFFTIWTQAAATSANDKVVLWAAVGGGVLGALFTIFYFGKFFPNVPPEARKAHMWVSTLAFIVYAYTIAGSAIPEVYFKPGIALGATALVTLISSVVVPTQK